MHFQTYCLHFWTYYGKMVLVIYMNYKKTILKEIISVKSIVTVHYFEYGKNYHFTGEEHNFWELIYVDRGTAEIFSGDTWQELKQGEIAFHKPGEFHNVRSNGRVAPNLVIIAFDCSSPTVDRGTVLLSCFRKTGEPPPLFRIPISLPPASLLL